MMYDILDKNSEKELFMSIDDMGKYYITDVAQYDQINAAKIIHGLINNYNVCFVCLDKSVKMGTMGTLEGEKITLAFEYALVNMLPIISIIASGGIRVNEGTSALMQMAKTVAAAKKHGDKGLLHISIITNPTLGGVSASFVSLADIIIAEPNAIYGFTGKRIIEETTHQKLPSDFQTAKYVKQHGMIDIITPWINMKCILTELLRLHNQKH